MAGALDCGLGLLHGGDGLVDADLVLDDADDCLRGADVQALELDDDLGGQRGVLHGAADLADGAGRLVDGDLAGVDGGAELVGELGEAGHQPHRPAEGADGGASSQSDELRLLRSGLERLLSCLLALGLLSSLFGRAGSGGFLALAERLLGDAAAELVGLGLGALHLGDRVGLPAGLGVGEFLDCPFGGGFVGCPLLRRPLSLPFGVNLRLDGGLERGADLGGVFGQDERDGSRPFPAVGPADVVGAARRDAGDAGGLGRSVPVGSVRSERLDEPQVGVLVDEAFRHLPTSYFRHVAKSKRGVASERS